MASNATIKINAFFVWITRFILSERCGQSRGSERRSGVWESERNCEQPGDEVNAG